MTKADLLRQYARIAEEHPFATATKAGQGFQRAMVTFVAEAGDPRAGTYDLFLLTARALLAFHLAENDGAMSDHQINEMLLEFGRAVAREKVAFDAATGKKEMH